MSGMIDYNADGDAQTLAEAEVIRADAKRMEQAKSAAVRLEKDARVRADSFSKIAKHIYPSMR